MNNCVTDTVLLKVKRYGASAFDVDGSFDSRTETYTSGCGNLIPGLQLSYHKVSGGVLTEMTAGEKIDIDADDAIQAIGAEIICSRQTLESIGADINIEWRPFVSSITAYVSEITLADGTSEGQIKKIYNDGTGGAIFINGAYHGGDTQLRINENRNCILMWNGSLWRHIDGILGITISTP